MRIILLSLSILISLTILMPQLVQAQAVPAKIGVTQPNQNAGVQVGTTPVDNLLQNIVTAFINLLFGVGGIGIVIMVIWGGVEWVLSGGEKEKIAAARKRITSAIIGMIVLAFAFVAIQLIGNMIGFNPLVNIAIPSFTK